MRHSVLNVLGLAAMGVILAEPGAAQAAEAPIANAEPNAPGWITVSYSHSGGTGEEIRYYIVRKGEEGEPHHPLSWNVGLYTDRFLNPGTTYEYSVCAEYVATGETACTETSAKTLPGAGLPPNYNPPAINHFEASPDAITVHWGDTGDYSMLHVQLSDPEGHVDQRQVKNIPNAKWTFVGLRPSVRYRVILQGCSKNLVTPDGCGRWSPDYFIITEVPKTPPPPPPPIRFTTFTVRGVAPKVVRLDFAVDSRAIYEDQKFLVYRDGKQVTEVLGPSNDVYQGYWQDFLNTLAEQHNYRVCFVDPPDVNVCSATVAGPEPSTGIGRMPDSVGGSDADPKYQKNTDMPGSDYSSFETTKAADAECSIACSKDERCVAWTWVRPGIQAPKGKCWLKNAEPAAVANNCCISGLKSKYRLLGKKP